MAPQILADAGFTDVDAQLEQLAVNARCTPQRIFANERWRALRSATDGDENRGYWWSRRRYRPMTSGNSKPFANVARNAFGDR